MVENNTKEPEFPLYKLERYLKGLTLYQHFKGKIVQKLDEALHSETGETLFLYCEFNIEKAAWDKQIWARPMGMFLENIPYTNTQRFKPITPEQGAKLLYNVLNKLQTQ